ncbi:MULTISPECIES: hypothetical protein [unclassified Microbulbifer]|uniref:hypothetical protein n=1 Tax=unclassified Microbulbifer TaxID=2619833 RepID=UPI0027E4343B|nr:MULTISPECIES: hypothetical protein [unclassified Microbulbifer]
MDGARLLIVEDDAAQVDTWKRQIERNNAKNEENYSADYASSYEQAEKLINSNKYDAAIVDIRLENPIGVQEATTEGNDVRDLLLRSEIVLVAHVTGEPDAVNIGDAHYKGLVRIFTKADSSEERSVHEEVLSWLREKSDIIEAMKTVKSNIASKMADLFYASIWPRWPGWKSASDENGDFISSSITRHITSHLYSKFLEEGEGKVHPEEWYFQPPSQDRFHTGDIVKIGDSHYILVTPRCDLERLSPGSTLLFSKMKIAECWTEEKKKVDEKVAGLTSQLKGANEQRQTKLKKKIGEAYSSFRKKYYGHQDGNFSLHFLPEITKPFEDAQGPFFVDFSDITTIVIGSGREEELEKIAALSPEFVPALVQRLGVFMSRIGSPDYSHF